MGCNLTAWTNSGGDIEMMRHGPTSEGVCDIMNISELVTYTPPGLDPCASPFISLNDFTVTAPQPRDSCSSADIGSPRDTARHMYGQRCIPRYTGHDAQW